MPTTARLLTLPYRPATCRVVEPDPAKYMRIICIVLMLVMAIGLVAWACGFTGAVDGMALRAGR